MTITFTTDFEPHRIKTMRKNPPKTIEAGRFLASGKAEDEMNVFETQSWGFIGSCRLFPPEAENTITETKKRWKAS